MLKANKNNYLLWDVLLYFILRNHWTIWSYNKCNWNLSCNFILHSEINVIIKIYVWRENKQERIKINLYANYITYDTTAASEMLGWATSMASSSAGATWNPLYLINSFNRSTMKSSSLSSMYPISPVCNHPPLSIVLSVASWSFR